MRFGLVEPRAARLPQVIVMTDKTPRAMSQTAEPSVASGEATTSKMRNKPSTPMALLAVASTPAIGAAAPA